jgi:hypothetical protein
MARGMGTYPYRVASCPHLPDADLSSEPTFAIDRLYSGEGSFFLDSYVDSRDFLHSETQRDSNQLNPSLRPESVSSNCNIHSAGHSLHRAVDRARRLDLRKFRESIFGWFVYAKIHALPCEGLIPVGKLLALYFSFLWGSQSYYFR